MPKNLDGATGSFPTQTSPISGEARTAAGVETPFQNSADRTQYLYDRLIYVDPSKGGVRRLRRVASIAVLQAVTDLTNQSVIIVDGIGLYVYDELSTATALSPFVVTPTVVGGGPGRWLWEAYGALDIANGIPKLDGTGRLAISKMAASEGGTKILAKNVTNGLVGVFTSSEAGPNTTTSTSYTNVGSIAPSFSMEIGDLVMIMGQAVGYQQDLTPAKHFTQWLVTKPDTSTATVATSETERKPSALNESESIAITTYYTASAAGTHTFRMQQKSEAASGGATVAVKNINVVALHFRP